MQKIYVLLRNDQQTGPYSLEEIIQFDLKPYDLIWIEGKSAGWYYPQEIGALRPYLGFLPKKPAAQNTTAPKTVFVSLPGVVQKEEPLAAPLPAAAPETPKETLRFFAPASKNLEEEVYAQFTPKTAGKEPALETMAARTEPPKKKQKPALSVGVAITAVFVVGGVFAASWIMNRHSNEEEDLPPLTASSAPAQEVAATAPATANHPSPGASPSRVSKPKHLKSISYTKRTTTAVKQSTVQKQPESLATNSPQKNAATADKTTTVPVKEEPVTPQEQTTASPAETAPPQEKKKKLRDKIFDIFRNKPEEPKTGEAQPSETTNGERRSTHRESPANLAQMVSVRFTVPNDWMMGVRGAKATLVNRSSQKVDKATVEVLYYNDDNELLQKKIISFSKVDGKESQTIAIPDHPSATRVDYNLISVTGQPSA